MILILDIDENCIMVLKGVGPVGYPGMPEVGNLELPEKLIKKGITDMVRISDGRMSGTAYGTVVLHVSPESSIGGTLALVENGDMIELDVKNRSLNTGCSRRSIAKKKRCVDSCKTWMPVVDMFVCSFNMLNKLTGDVILIF